MSSGISHAIPTLSRLVWGQFYAFWIGKSLITLAPKQTGRSGLTRKVPTIPPEVSRNTRKVIARGSRSGKIAVAFPNAGNAKMFSFNLQGSYPGKTAMERLSHVE